MYMFMYMYLYNNCFVSFLQAYARSPEDLSSGMAILKSSIVDIKRNIAPENAHTVTSEKFQRYIDQQKRDYAGEMLFKLESG